MDIEILPQRLCRKCKNLFPLSSFYKSSDSKDGYMRLCTGCATPRERVLVTCKDCGVEWSMRKGQLKIWAGRCKKCAAKEVCNRAEVRAKRSAAAKIQIAKNGGKVPNCGSNPRRGPSNNKWKGGLPSCLTCGKTLSTYRARLCEQCNRKELSEKMKGGKRAMYRHIPKGELNRCWKGGKPNRTKRNGSTSASRQWRHRVFERDNYTCVFCGAQNVQLHADHIHPVMTHPDLEFDPENGRTLCVSCHVQTPTYGWRGFFRVMGEIIAKKESSS